MTYGHANAMLVASLRRRTLDRKRWFQRLLDEQRPQATPTDAPRGSAPGATGAVWQPVERAAP